jgi:ring-1,2-phenylacetyl-CoA epoxidase subunit PaaD
MVTPLEAAGAVVDPELRVVTIDELGILRSVETDDATGQVVVTITPTYTGCPAMDVIRADITRTLAAQGYPDVEIRTVLRPAWTTEMMSDTGRRKLAAAGIAPPSTTRPSVVALKLSVACPRCASLDTEELSHFGSTACKSLWRCRGCGEPFDRIKPL